MLIKSTKKKIQRCQDKQICIECCCIVLLWLCIHTCACIQCLAVKTQMPVFTAVLCARVCIAVLLNICLCYHATHSLFFTQNAAHSLREACYSCSQYGADIACHGLCVWSNHVFFFPETITQQILWKSFRTVICDLMVSSQVLSFRKVSQRFFWFIESYCNITIGWQTSDFYWETCMSCACSATLVGHFKNDVEISSPLIAREMICQICQRGSGIQLQRLAASPGNLQANRWVFLYDCPIGNAILSNTSFFMFR